MGKSAGGDCCDRRREPERTGRRHLEKTARVGKGSRGTRRGVPPGEPLARLPISKQKRELRGGLDRWRRRIGVKATALGRLALARLVEVDANDFAKGRAVFPAAVVDFINKNGLAKAGAASQ